MIPDQTTQAIHDKSIRTMVKVYILAMLRENNYNLTKTARDLGISRMSLYRRMVEYGIKKNSKQQAAT